MCVTPACWDLKNNNCANIQKVYFSEMVNQILKKQSMHIVKITSSLLCIQHLIFFFWKCLFYNEYTCTSQIKTFEKCYKTRSAPGAQCKCP